MMIVIDQPLIVSLVVDHDQDALALWQRNQGETRKRTLQERGRNKTTDERTLRLTFPASHALATAYTYALLALSLVYMSAILPVFVRSFVRSFVDWVDFEGG